VLDASGALRGIVGARSIGLFSPEPELRTLAVAADLMLSPVALRPTDSIRRAAELFLESDLRQLPVVGPDDRVVGFIDEADVTRAHLEVVSTTLGQSTSTAVAPPTAQG